MMKLSGIRIHLAMAIGISSMLTAQSAGAYIPTAKTIFARTVKGNGTGAYVIEQDVIFRSEAEPIALRERWTVASGDALRLLVLPAPVSSSSVGQRVDARLDVIYREGRRMGPDPRMTNIPAEFFEAYSHFRSARALADALLRAKIIPNQLFRERQPLKNLKDLRYVPEPFVQLTRKGGTINWSFGEPTPPNAATPNGALWIEQDVFAVRRLRFPASDPNDQVDVTYDNDGTFAGGLRLARLRTVTWGRHIAEIRTVSVRAANERQSLEQTRSLNQGEAQAARLPDVESVRQFYARFR